MLGALSLLLNGGGLEQIKTITHELNQTLSGHTGDIRNLLSQAVTLTTSLNRQKSRILTAIDHLDALATTLDKQKQILAGALDTMPQAIKILADEKDQFVTLLKSLDRLSGVAVSVVNQSQDNFVASLKSLDPVLTEFTKAGDALPKSFELLATFPFPKPAVDGIRGDYTNLYRHRGPEPVRSAGQPAQDGAAASGDPGRHSAGATELTGLEAEAAMISARRPARRSASSAVAA